ncbi:MULTISPECIES: class I SAM-dependent methyltransferase [Prochlorococcus]|nr:class I SAM-dependent methyltransferase [Prochlorococcus marinus]
MKRDFICLLRIFIDSLPEFIRNSEILFRISMFIFKVPASLFTFRKKYKSGIIKDLSEYYSANESFSLKRISKDTDINSLHLRIIKRYFKKYLPNSLLDAGCGSCYLLDNFRILKPSAKLVGIDYDTPISTNNKFKLIEGDILNTLKGFLENSFEFVVCTHVIEHLNYPDEVVLELRRVCSKILIIICPIEKELKWGMNYHINFYSNKKYFLNFILDTKLKNKKINNYKIYQRLGDLMYVENII